MALIWTILESAFGVRQNQIKGVDWGGDERYDIVANVPPGATKEQVQEMMQNLLKDRFHLSYHREQKDVPGYTLRVAKGGAKLTPAAPGSCPPPPPDSNARKEIILDQDGFPQLPAGCRGTQPSTVNGVVRKTVRNISMGLFVNSLTGGIVPIVDETGLTGACDIRLEYSLDSLAELVGSNIRTPADESEPAPDIFTALETQLGLKLEKSVAKIDVVVIDRLDKTPTEN